MGILSRARQLVASGDSAIYNRIKEVVRTIRFAASPRLYGRTTSGAGEGEEISVGTGLTLANGVLSATGGGTVTSVNVTGSNGIVVTGSVITTSGTFALSVNAASMKSFLAISSSDITDATESNDPGTLVKRSVLTGQIAVGGLQSVGDFGYVIAEKQVQTSTTFNFFNGGFLGQLSLPLTANRAIAFPDASGIVALTSQITNSVTSATSSDGTATLSVSTLTATVEDYAAIQAFSTTGTGADLSSTNGIGAFIASETGVGASISSNSGIGANITSISGKIISGNNATTEVFAVSNAGVMQATGLDITGTSFTYGAGSQSAHRTALGLDSINAHGLKSATTTVSISSATAPTSGQVLTATSSTAATWQTPSGGSVAIGSVTGLGENVATSLAINTGSAGAIVLNGGTGTNMTLGGTLTINSTSVSFGAGAAAAMRTALSLSDRQIMTNQINFLNPTVGFFEDFIGNNAANYQFSLLSAGSGNAVSFVSNATYPKAFGVVQAATGATSGNVCGQELRSSNFGAVGMTICAGFAVPDPTNVAVRVGMSNIFGVGVFLLANCGASPGNFQVLSGAGSTVVTNLSTTNAIQAGNYASGKRYRMMLTYVSLTSVYVRLDMADWNSSTWTTLHDATITIPTNIVTVFNPYYAIINSANAAKTLLVDWMSMSHADNR